MHASWHNPLIKPEILAPAGGKASFLAALAAGADAVYCGMKQFSARMQAKNFGFPELGALTRLAHQKGVRVYVAVNTAIRPDELAEAAGLLAQLVGEVGPDALIVQDPGVVALARQVGFQGELHLSTLANVSFGSALKLAHQKLGVNRVVLPRELHVDEIKSLAKVCPPGMRLEVFVHGALCYGISGRCYWSSYLGGKSSLRGRCVQPCRRRYTLGAKASRFFSCQDLSLDVLVNVLKTIPEVSTWKIEGRKKGPHYVYYTVQAYKMLRDQAADPKMKKAALELLSLALGRTGTHYNFLPQRPQDPINVDGQTGSGLLVGRLQGGGANPYITAREDLFKNDVLRIGYEDDRWHAVRTVTRFTPKKGRLFLKVPGGKKEMQGTPVFLIDRKEKYLEQKLAALEKEMEEQLDKPAGRQKSIPRSTLRLPRPASGKINPFDMHVFRKPDGKSFANHTGLWLSGASISKMPSRASDKTWWWLPPVIWPATQGEIENQLHQVLERGARNFVLNAPWQAALFPHFKGMRVWAGPFCNIANPLAVNTLKTLGFAGAVVSPEMGRNDVFTMPQASPLPLGIVLSGFWPLCISRILSPGIEQNRPFSSPKGEQAWAVKYGHEYWLFPNWKLDLTSQKDRLRKAGYRCFVDLHEPVPRKIKMKAREGKWNWEIGLK
jgi:putative protease